MAEVLDQLASCEDLALRARHEMASAIRTLCKAIGMAPRDLACDPTLLRRYFIGMTAASTGMSPARWRNIKSLVTRAMRLTGAVATGRRSRENMSPEWRELLDRVSDGYDRSKLTRFARYCSLHSISPAAVDDAVLTAFATMLVAQSTVERPKQAHRDTAITWNRLIARINGWPETRLTVPDHRRDFSKPLVAFPASFQTDLGAYLEHLGGKDLFSDSPRAPASPVTIRNARIWLLEIATALTLSGRSIETISSLADVVATEAARAELNFFWQRNGKRKSGQLHNFARLLINVARHWVKVPPEHLAQLQAIRRQVDPGKGGLTDRNRARLRVFDDPVNVARLVNLPQTMMKPLLRASCPSYNNAIAVQSAVAIALQLIAPLRAKNLAGLRIDQHLVRARSGPGAVMHLVLPAHEVKNNSPLEFELPPDVVRLLDFYVERFQPLLTTEGTPFLFPARQGGAKSPAQIAEQIKRAIKIGTGLTLNLHLFRHLAAFLFLKAHPGEYETVRLLLGHKDIATTVRAYCGLERADAIRRYDSLIEGYRHPANRSHVA